MALGALFPIQHCVQCSSIGVFATGYDVFVPLAKSGVQDSSIIVTKSRRLQCYAEVDVFTHQP